MAGNLAEAQFPYVEIMGCAKFGTVRAASTGCLVLRKQLRRDGPREKPLRKTKGGISQRKRTYTKPLKAFSLRR